MSTTKKSSENTALDTVKNEVVTKRKGNNMSAAKWEDEHVKPGDNARFLKQALATYNLPTINIEDPKQVQDRIEWYFHHCVQHDMKPTVTGMANALGVTRQCLFQWQTDVLKNRKGQGEIVRKAKALLEEMMEQYMLNGKINPVSGIFLMKNNFEGYYDKSEVILTPNNPLEPQKDEEELKRLYAANDVED